MRPIVAFALSLAVPVALTGCGESQASSQADTTAAVAALPGGLDPYPGAQARQSFSGGPSFVTADSPAQVIDHFRAAALKKNHGIEREYEMGIFRFLEIDIGTEKVLTVKTYVEASEGGTVVILHDA